MPPIEKCKCFPTGAIEMQTQLHECSAGERSHLPRSACKLFAGLAGAILMFTGSQAMAGPCLPYFANMYGWIADGSAQDFSVEAVRITARGEGGFSSFSMGKHYNSSLGIANSSAAGIHKFYLSFNPTNRVFFGRFQDVFPGRSNGHTDDTTLYIRPSGEVQFRLHDWGDVVGTLSSVDCSPGDTGRAFVMTGQASSPGYGRDFWTFLIVPHYAGIF